MQVSQMMAGFGPNAVNPNSLEVFSRYRLVKSVRSLRKLILLYAGQHNDRFNLSEDAVKALEGFESGACTCGVTAIVVLSESCIEGNDDEHY